MNHGLKAPTRIEPDEARWRQLALLAFAMVLAMTTWFSTAAVLPQLRTEFDLSATTSSFLAIAVQLGFVAGALLSAASNLADRVPPRRLVFYGASGAAAANALLLVSGELILATASRFLVGVCLASVYPPALKAMSTWFIRGRGLALGTMVGALTLGSSLPHLISSFGGLRWQIIILVTSGSTIAGGLVTEFVAKDGPHRFPSAPFDPSQIRATLADRRVRLATLGYFGHMWELYAMWGWIGVFYADVFPTRPTAAALSAFAVIGVGALGSVAGGLISDRTSRSRAAGLSMSISGLMAGTVGFLVDRPVLAVIGGLVWGFWVIADSAQFSTIVTEAADQRFVGTALTVQLALGFVLTVFTIFLVPWARDQSSWGIAFLLLMPGPLLGVVAMRRLEVATVGTSPHGVASGGATRRKG